MDVTTLAVHVASAVVGGVGGFASTIRTIRKNVSVLDRKLKKLTEEVVLLSDVDIWKQSVIQGLRLEWEQLKLEIERRVSSFERQSNPIGFEDFKRRLDELERTRHQVLDQRFVTQTEFNEFIREGARQWNEINRSLGIMMGELKTKSR